MTKIQFWEEDVHGGDVLVTANLIFHKGTEGNIYDPPEYEWLEVDSILLNGKMYNEEETIKLIGYDWELLISKIYDNFYLKH